MSELVETKKETESELVTGLVNSTSTTKTPLTTSSATTKSVVTMVISIGSSSVIVTVASNSVTSRANTVFSGVEVILTLNVSLSSLISSPIMRKLIGIDVVFAKIVTCPFETSA